MPDLLEWLKMRGGKIEKKFEAGYFDGSDIHFPRGIVLYEADSFNGDCC